MTLILNRFFEEEKDLRELYEEEARKSLIGANLRTQGKKAAPLLSMEKMACLLASEPIPDSQLPSKQVRRGSSIGLVLNTPLMSPTPQMKSPSTKKEVKQEYVVRIPVNMNSHYSFTPVSEAKFFLYCYSFKPQTYWIKRATFATFQGVSNCTLPI